MTDDVTSMFSKPVSEPAFRFSYVQGGGMLLALDSVYHMSGDASEFGLDEKRAVWALDPVGGGDVCASVAPFALARFCADGYS